jgi:hypothetical protein
MNSPKQLKKLSQVGSALIAASTLCLIFAFITVLLGDFALLLLTIVYLFLSWSPP